MEIEVETDGASVKEKKIAKLFSPKKKLAKKSEKKIKAMTEEKTKTVSRVAKPEKKRNKLVLFTIPLLAVSCLALGFFTYYYRNKYVQLVKTPTILEKNERELVLGNISSLAELPGGEEPIIATAGDVEKLTGQAFSSDVSLDDRAVIYLDAKKAIVYRPSSGKIVEAASFSLVENKTVAQSGVQVIDGSSAGQDVQIAQVAGADIQNTGQLVNQTKPEKISDQMTVQTATQADKKFRVTIYNGTSAKGVAEKMAKTISSANANIDVVKKTNATGDYAKTTVIDLSGDNGQFSTDLAGAIGGEVTATVPEGEAVPEADVLVIVGGE